MDDGGITMPAFSSTNPPHNDKTQSTTTYTDLPIPSESVASKVASCALDHYHRKLPNKGKPKPGQEWTVFAAIVAFHRTDDRMWVVSCATGTKCTAQRHEECILHDSHAEVLARRGLIRVLLSEIKETKQRCCDAPGKETEEENANSKALLVESRHGHQKNERDSKKESLPGEQQYELNPNIELHFYISDSPCGDASIYGVPNETGKDTSEILYTGAKVIVSQATKVNAEDCGGNHQLLLDTKYGTECSTTTTTATPVVAREAIQVLGKLRTKSGRSNLPAHMRSHSHSCSDKLASWGVLGLQGALLTKLFNPPIIPLKSVVVSRDSRLSADNSDNNCEGQRLALERAIPDRAKHVWEYLSAHPSWKPSIPTVHIVPEIYVSGKAAMIARPSSKNLSGNKRKQSCTSSEEGKSIEVGRKTKNEAVVAIQKVPPCGMSLNWNQGEDVEILVGARGIKHGKKPKNPQDYEKMSSRLSRAKLLQEYFSFLHQTKNLNEAENSYGTNSYHRIKDATGIREWVDLKSQILTQNGSPLVGWLRRDRPSDTCVSCKDEKTSKSSR